jgi:predicted MFS family arabinose efflux permease
MNAYPRLINRNFILAFCAQLSLMSVYQLLIPTLPLYLKRLGSTEIEVGLLVGTMGIASVFARPIVGKLLSKTGARFFMLMGASLYIAASAAYLIAPPFWPLLFIRILHGAAFGFFHTASTTYVVNVTEPTYRARALAYFALTMNFAGTIAPPLGVVLLNRYGSPYLFLTCTAVSVCIVLFTSTLGLSTSETPENNPEHKASLFSKGAIPHSVVGFMALWVWASMTTFYPIFATKQGVANPGLFFTTMAITLIISRIVGGRILDMVDRRILVLCCLATSIVAMIVLSLSRSQPMFLFSAIIWSSGHAFLLPSLMTLAIERSGSPASSVVATVYSISDVGVFSGPLVMGVVIHYSNYPLMFLCLSFVGFVNLIYFWWFTSRPQNVKDI